ncbi:MAG: N-acetyl-gamma-glutamyl-phosphate reductase [archaeon]|nr:N-acetyl-gamma-glutamyl-phosphate reductase [archaeon]
MKVGIVGGSGYTGGEILRLISIHPKAELAWITSRNHIGKAVSTIHPNMRSFTEERFGAFNEAMIDKCDVMFLALPHGSSMDFVKQHFGKKRIIDLSADFRIKNLEIFNRYYKQHSCPELLEKAVYGLPELHKKEIADSQLVANPGCIATSMILALHPLTQILKNAKIAIDVKIGSTASGRTPTHSNIHAERTGIVRAYETTDHRHLGEVEQQLGLNNVGITCHAVDTPRGILTTIHAFPQKLPTEKEIRELYRNAYSKEPFVRIVAKKNPPYNLPDIKTTTHSNFAEIGYAIDERTNRLVVFSAIDNMIKGAAGQAIQNMNIMFGLEETTGLMFPGYYF